MSMMASSHQLDLYWVKIGVEIGMEQQASSLKFIQHVKLFLSCSLVLLV